MSRMVVGGFGVAIAIEGPPDLLASVETLSAPLASLQTADEPSLCLSIESQDGSHVPSRKPHYLLTSSAAPILARERDAGVIAELAAGWASQHVAEHAPEHVFVHAGVVAFERGAILLPGSTMTGKSTLVRALLDVGATYLSDEYAPLDRRGSVWPFARPLSLRRSDGNRDRLSAGDVGARTATGPIPVSAILLTSHRPGARWRPERLSEGQATLAMLEHTLPSRQRPQQCMAHLGNAARGAIAIRTWRGEAAEVAERVAALVGARTDTPPH